MMFLCVSEPFLQRDNVCAEPLQLVLSTGDAVPMPDPLNRLACWRVCKPSPESVRKLKAWGRTQGVSLAFFDRLPKWSDFSVLMTDMDHTLIDADVFKELAVLAGQEERYQRVMTALSEGELTFDVSLQEKAVLLKGLPESAIEQVVSGLTFTSGIVTLIDEARHHNLRTYVLSSGIDDIAQHLSEMLCMTGAIANHLAIHEGQLTADIKGPFGGPLLDARGKCRQMNRIAQALSMRGAGGVLCCGDGDNDALMLKTAGMGISFYGTFSAVEAANVNINSGGFEWVVDLLGLHERLALPEGGCDAGVGC